MSENTITVQELDMLDKREERDKYIDKVEVLDKVKQIIMLPKLEMVTTNQVAEYFGVDTAAIRKCYQRNAIELNADGAKVEYLSRFNEVLSVNNRHIQGSRTFNLPNGTEITIPNCGIRCYTKRAVLRMAMLLRDSEVAKQIRTLLLNVTMVVLDKVTEQSTTSPLPSPTVSSEERQLVIEVGEAFNTGDIVVFGTACTKMIAFKNKQIKALEEQNDKLLTANGKLSERNQSLKNSNDLIAEDNVKWTSRKTISRLIRRFAQETNATYRSAWAQFYTHLSYKYGICLRQRAQRANDYKSPLIDFIKENEWPTIESAFASLLQVNGFDPDDFYKQAIPNIVHAVAVR